MLIILLFVLGLCFGSFVNALTWRLYTKKDWVKARSQCPKCGHILAPADLVPLFSWLVLRAKCRYCKQSISSQYPIVELAGGLVFALSYHYWPISLSGGQWLLFVSWLVVFVGLLALAVYDLKWMLLPNKIIYPTLVVAVLSRLIYLIAYQDQKLHALLSWVLAVAVASGIFWILFNVSRGKWIGYGDVRLGLITGTVLASPARSLLMIFLASVFGSLFALPALLSGRQKADTKFAYGPFLIAATFVVLLWGDQIINWYKNLYS